MAVKKQAQPKTLYVYNIDGDDEPSRPYTSFDAAYKEGKKAIEDRMRDGYCDYDEFDLEIYQLVKQIKFKTELKEVVTKVHALKQVS